MQPKSISLHSALTGISSQQYLGLMPSEIYCHHCNQHLPDNQLVVVYAPGTMVELFRGCQSCLIKARDLLDGRLDELCGCVQAAIEAITMPMTWEETDALIQHFQAVLQAVGKA